MTKKVDGNGKNKTKEQETPKTVTKHLRCELTTEEKQEIAGKMARAVSDKILIDTDFKSVKDQFKAKLSQKDAAISEYANLLNAGFEIRPVECTVDKDYKKNTVTYFRTDTNEPAEQRTMMEHERQIELEVDPGADQEAESIKEVEETTGETPEEATEETDKTGGLF